MRFDDAHPGRGAVLGEIRRVCAINALAIVIGGAIFVALFQLGLGNVIAIVFYRGVVLSVAALALTAAALAWIGHRTGFASIAEATSAALLSLGLNIAILVLFPVTVDRSISVFMLGYMEAHGEQALTEKQLSAAFVQTYVHDLDQIKRRLGEQSISGNVVADGDGFRLTPQGSGFMRFSRMIATVFHTSTELVSQPLKPEPARR